MRPIANSLFARRSFRRAVIGAVTGIVAVGGYLYVRTNNDRAHVSAQLVIEAQAGNSDIVKDLMSRGADVNAKSADGTSAIALAAEKKHYDVVLVLLSEGADPHFGERVGRSAIQLADDPSIRRRLIAGSKNKD